MAAHTAINYRPLPLSTCRAIRQKSHTSTRHPTAHEPLIVPSLLACLPVPGRLARRCSEAHPTSDHTPRRALSLPTPTTRTPRAPPRTHTSIGGTASGARHGGPSPAATPPSSVLSHRHSLALCCQHECRHGCRGFPAGREVRLAIRMHPASPSACIPPHASGYGLASGWASGAEALKAGRVLRWASTARRRGE